MRIVIVTDIHWKNAPGSRRVLEDVIRYANGEVDGKRADMYVDLGDRINQQGLRVYNQGMHHWFFFNDAQSLMQVA